MRRYRIEVGHNNKVRPGNILGAIANEADMDSEYIGSIQIFDDFSTVDLPDEMPDEVFSTLQKAIVCNQCLDIAELTDKNNKTTIARKKGKRNFGRGKFSRGGRNDRRNNNSNRRRNRKPKFSHSKNK